MSEEREDVKSALQAADMDHELDALGVSVVSQDKLERSVAKQADRMINERDEELDQRRLDRAHKEQLTLERKIIGIEERLENSRTQVSVKTSLREQLKHSHAALQQVFKDISDIRGRIDDHAILKLEGGADAPTSGDESTGKLDNESHRDFLIRTGKITPFANLDGLDRSNAIAHDAGEEFLESANRDSLSHQDLREPGFAPAQPRKRKLNSPDLTSSAHTTDTVDERKDLDKIFDDESATSNENGAVRQQSSMQDEGLSTHRGKRRRSGALKKEDDSEDEYLPDSSDSIPGSADSSDEDHRVARGRTAATSAGSIESDDGLSERSDDEQMSTEDVDDGNEAHYIARLESWSRNRRRARSRQAADTELQEEEDADELPDETQQPHPTVPSLSFSGGFRVPGDIHASLFDYQKTCVQWLWELHSQGCGGIIGDEMGLGKTVQIISFIAGLQHSGMLRGPVLVVAPATVLKMWVKEFHRWWPPLRICILHSSGEAAKKGNNARAETRKVLNRVVKDGHVLVTTYSGLTTYKELIDPVSWSYAILDEGHKIRNPDSEVSLAAKQLKTVHRIILSGTPIQNNLTELWSLFDFVFPGRLGTLPIFQAQFALPINIGGYANASNVQVQTAYKCACVLRDLINPYLLRRMKADVAADLPSKSEQVLFCKLTSVQRREYELFLSSADMSSILDGKRQVLFGVDVLRKICNHPDLVQREHLLRRGSKYSYGDPSKSGKMQVLKALIELWKQHGHRTLIFSQGRQMLDILETFVSSLQNVRYCRMDGTTPIARRQQLVDDFNNDASYHVFLLTTRVGGLGVNLTGADRVIIFDPDWNPSTDVQARERAWRLGQKKDVTIYRLMTSGTIEEKIYHRQIFKQFLTNKILKDPKQRRFFKTNDLHDLFSLGSEDFDGTETGDMFEGTERRVQPDKDCEDSDDKLLPTTAELRQGQASSANDARAVRTLQGVASVREYAASAAAGILDASEADVKSNNATGTAASEQNVLSSIFSRAGVQSTLQHDAIMEAARPEQLLVTREADRIAREAAEALKRSRRDARRGVGVGVPTWTGRFGNNPQAREASSDRSSSRGISPVSGSTRRVEPAGDSPLSRLSSPARQVLGFQFNRAGPKQANSSASLLAGMARRREQAGEVKNEHSESRPHSRSAALETRLEHAREAAVLQRLADFIVSRESPHRGGAGPTSQEVVDHFASEIEGTEAVAVFKRMLRTVAEQRRPAGSASAPARWRVKDEYR